MTEADIILTPLPQADGVVKNRPALLLRELPPFGDFRSQTNAKLTCALAASEASEKASSPARCWIAYL